MCPAYVGGKIRVLLLVKGECTLNNNFCLDWVSFSTRWGWQVEHYQSEGLKAGLSVSGKPDRYHQGILKALFLSGPGGGVAAYEGKQSPGLGACFLLLAPFWPWSIIVGTVVANVLLWQLPRFLGCSLFPSLRWSPVGFLSWGDGSESRKSKAAEGHRVEYQEGDNCPRKNSEIHKVPLESSAECWSV